jgi:1A family penicillin-binding protein
MLPAYSPFRGLNWTMARCRGFPVGTLEAPQGGACVEGTLEFAAPDHAHQRRNLPIYLPRRGTVIHGDGYHPLLLNSLRWCRNHKMRLNKLNILLFVGLATAPLSAQQSGGEAWRIIQPPQATQVFARDGSLIGEIGRQIRISVPLSSLPKYVANAFVAVEDQRFYVHDGVDVIGIAGAIKDNLLGDHRGASTITQQLVGNMHPDIINRQDKSIGRKLREQAAAREMEKRYTKQQILEAYINLIDFGHGWYGIESAARHYFGKSASQLSLAEAATLAALPKGPARYNPISHRDRALQRRNVVLTLMAQQKYITVGQAAQAKAESLVVAPNRGMAAPSEYFVDVVRIQAERAGIDVMGGGYRIYTSLDPHLQTAATQALRDEAAKIEARPGYSHPTLAKHAPGKSDYLQGLVVMMDPSTGDVRALVGGRDYHQSPYNRAVDAVRQPGSAFKPLLYAAALERGFSPTTPVADTAVVIRLPNGRVYEPENADHSFLGTMTLRDALAKSRNVVAVQIGQQLSLDSVAETARRIGLKSPIDPVPASAIGASVVQPLNLIAAYTAFANLGASVEPRFVYRVEDREGKVLWSVQPRALGPGLDARVAFVMRDMMRDVVERGTAASVRQHLPATIPAAGKTGTTNDNSDVWFVGLTPELVGGVWLGFDRPVTIATGAGGGSLAAPVWARVMAAHYGARTPVEWIPPIGVIPVELDRATGQQASDSTPPERRYTEYYVEGTEPAFARLDIWRLFKRITGIIQ